MTSSLVYIMLHLALSTCRPHYLSPRVVSQQTPITTIYALTIRITYQPRICKLPLPTVQKTAVHHHSASTHPPPPKAKPIATLSETQNKARTLKRKCLGKVLFRAPNWG